MKHKNLFFKLTGFVLIIAFSCSAQNNYNIPKLSEPGEGAYLKGELIYPLDAKPTPECHASTLVELEDGVVAAWFGGTEEKHPDVGIWISMNLDGTWSKPVEVADGFQNDTLRYPCWNPVLFKDRNGALLLFYKVGPNPRDWWGMLTISENNGRTWSNPVKLGENEKIGHLLGPVKNKPIQLADGTMLCPSSSEIEQDGETYWKVHFERTRDLGKTWEVVGPINDGIEFDAIQPSILTFSGGRMQVLCRTRENVVSQSWSDDGGNTWSKMTATALPNPNAGTDAVTLNDGRQLLIYNHTVRRSDFPRGRNMLNLAISENGIDWKPVLTLERQEGEYSYPAIIQAKNGLVHITYTYQRKSVKYVVVDPEKL